MSDINVTVQDEIVNIDVLDTPVLVNVVNSPGQQGPAGPGVPVGGTAGQILAKASATNYDTEWINNYAKYLATNVRNQTGSTIAAFQVVYISGATGNKPLISLADADTEATSSKTYGVTATAISNNGTGDVVTAGELSGINTSAFNEGDLLWLSTTAGGVVTTPPAEPAHAVFIGYVVRSHPTLGVIDVSIQNGYELNELHGVQITTPTDNQGLFYNATSTLWENKSITTALGYTPVPTTRNITINGVTYDLSADRTWTISTGISGSGAAGQVTYWTGASAVSGSNNLFWDNANGRLGVGTNVPAVQIDARTSANSGTELLRITNSSSGTLATAGLALQANVAYGALIATSSTYNALTFLGANAVGFYSTHRFVVAVVSGDFVIGTGATLTERMRLFGSTGNLSIGTASDLGTRLGVVGDTLLRGSGNTSATTALTVQNSDGNNILGAFNNRTVFIGSASGSFHAFEVNATTNASRIAKFGSLEIVNNGAAGWTGVGLSVAGSNRTLQFIPSASSALNALDNVKTFFSAPGGSWTRTSGSAVNFQILDTQFAPTSGNCNYTALLVQGGINQTGGANGISRGLYIAYNVVAAADFRAIETTNGNIVFGNLPTSSAGLPSGALWNNGGVINIV